MGHTTNTLYLFLHSTMPVLRVSASGLKQKDQDGTSSDPYYIIIDSSENVVHTSQTVADNVNPNWGTSPDLPNGVYTFKIRDEDIGNSDEGMGKVTVDISSSGSHSISNGGGTLRIEVVGGGSSGGGSGGGGTGGGGQPIECCMIL